MNELRKSPRPNPTPDFRAMRFQMDDGSQIDAAAGDVYLIPRGHDAWVVGGEPRVALDLG